MGLKILHSADWHLDSPFTGFSDRQRRFLTEQQRKIPEKIVDLCLREDCDMMLLAGDLFDGEPCRETVDLVKKELARCGVPVLIAPGNHDFCGTGNLWQEETWPENVFVFTGDLESVTIQGLNCRIYGAAFRSMDCPPLLEDFRAQGEERYRLAVLHGDPLQRNSPYNAITNAQVRGSGLNYLALGHIHKAGAFRSGKTMCAWPGCPMGRGWDETGEKGVYLVTLADSADIRFVPLDTPVFRDMELDVTDDPAAVVAAALPAAESDGFFRITLTGAAEVNLQMLQKSFARFPNLTFRDRTDPPVDVWADAGTDTFRGVYFGILRELAETDETAALAADISCRILSGREVHLP